MGEKKLSILFLTVRVKHLQELVCKQINVLDTLDCSRANPSLGKERQLQSARVWQIRGVIELIVTELIMCECGLENLMIEILDIHLGDVFSSSNICVWLQGLSQGIFYVIFLCF